MNRRQVSGELQDHIFGTYISLRYGLGGLGATLPLVLAGIGIAHGLGVQSSMSAYYWAAAVADGSPPSRDWLVGSLFAVAASLYMYKGFTPFENAVLNTAGVFAAGVALFPTAQTECVGRCPLLTFHGFCAVAMFACLTVVVWFCAGDTLSELSEQEAARYRKLYGVIGLVMLAAPLTAFVINSVVGRGKSYVFWVELAGIWAFAAYWFVKSGELAKSNATKRALAGELETSADGKAVPAETTARAAAPKGAKRG